jgi:hypothetical protein
MPDGRAGSGSPRGHGADTPHEHLEELARDECMLRLRARGVGRIGVAAPDGVAVFPVNYAVAEDAVIVRVRRGGVIDAATRDAVVALEIDHADSQYHEGWSVLVQGRCTQVDDPAELDALAQVPLEPWGDAARDVCLRIALDSVTGRTITHRAI